MSSIGYTLSTEEWTNIDGVEYKQSRRNEPSPFEIAIGSFLATLKFPFFHEVHANGCKDKQLLIFDFLIIHPIGPILLEFDGRQHFQYVERYHKGSIENLYHQQRRDGIKNHFTKGKVHFLRISSSALSRMGLIGLQVLLSTFVEKAKGSRGFRHFEGLEYKEGMCSDMTEELLSNEKCEGKSDNMEIIKKHLQSIYYNEKTTVEMGKDDDRKMPFCNTVVDRKYQFSASTPYTNPTYQSSNNSEGMACLLIVILLFLIGLQFRGIIFK